MLHASVMEVRPAMLILDPLYFMLGGADTDKSHQIVPFLKALTQLRFEYGCAIVLIHHMRKQQKGTPSARPGQNMLGSMAFHAWIASALYCTAADDENTDGWKRIVVEREFREQETLLPLRVSLRKGQPADIHGFEAIIGGFNKSDEVLDMVMEMPGITVNQVAKELEVTPRTVVNRARGTGRIRLEGGHKGSPRRMFVESSA
jgi:hypothetical protein